MPFAKVFKSGTSQAIHLPKEFRLPVKEVELIRQGNDILIRQPSAPETLAKAFHALASMPDDFFAEGRDEFPPAHVLIPKKKQPKLSPVQTRELI